MYRTNDGKQRQSKLYYWQLLSSTTIYWWLFHFFSLYKCCASGVQQTVLICSPNNPDIHVREFMTEISWLLILLALYYFDRTFRYKLQQFKKITCINLKEFKTVINANHVNEYSINKKIRFLSLKPIEEIGAAWSQSPAWADTAASIIIINYNQLPHKCATFKNSLSSQLFTHTIMQTQYKQ